MHARHSAHTFCTQRTPGHRWKQACKILQHRTTAPAASRVPSLLSFFSLAPDPQLSLLEISGQRVTSMAMAPPRALFFVTVNNAFLTNADQYINGQFSVVGSDIVLSSSVSLTVGDVIEIETNQFNLIQTIVAEEPFDESRFGSALQICNTNCSLYTGSPLASVDYPQEGLVQRNVNQSRVYGVITSPIANPVLTAGNTLRINNTLVTVPVSPNNTIAGLVDAINIAAIPNVIASSTPNLELPGDGISKIFDVGSIYSAAESYTVIEKDHILDYKIITDWIQCEKNNNVWH